MNTFQIITIFGCIAAISCLPRSRHVPLVSRTEVHDPHGQFSLSYQTGDGISFTEQGYLKRTNDGLDNVLVKQGGYAFVAPDGRTYTIHYVADENGFQPSGAHLPVPPAPVS